MPHLTSIVYSPAHLEAKPDDHFTRVPLARAELVPDYGIAGDRKGGPGKRQLNLMRAETIAELAAEGYKAGPGELGEQLVIAGLEMKHLADGTRLRLGSAVLELVEARNGCARFEGIQGRPRSASKGRLGYLARVIEGGEVGVGTTVEVL